MGKYRKTNAWHLFSGLTTMALILGFGVMTLSDISGWRNFGFLSGFAFLWAYLADFFLCPALILLLKPLGVEKQVSMDN